LIDRSRALAFPIQETAWALIGVSTYARQTGSPQAMGLARKLIAYISHDLLNRNTLLPKHNNSLRGTSVSFGAIVYFLMSLHHYASLFDDQARLALFKSAVTRVLELQGSNGEWPWFIDSATGRVMDWHQVYSVHQDAMAMLFLLPALDLGVAGNRKGRGAPATAIPRPSERDEAGGRRDARRSALLIVYVHTSALVPVFIREAKSEAVIAWLESSGERLAISEWSLVEFASAVAIKVRNLRAGDALHLAVAGTLNVQGILCLDEATIAGAKALGIGVVTV
jgi:predicted nucleic acid-binding protein